jgi:hypothetical protein
MSVKTKKLSTKSVQKFVRLNLDEKLDQLLTEFEQQYQLLNRSDIIRMLLSEIYYTKKQQKRLAFQKFLSTLPKGERLTIEDSFKLLKNEDLI